MNPIKLFNFIYVTAIISNLFIVFKDDRPSRNSLLLHNSHLRPIDKIHQAGIVASEGAVRGAGISVDQ